MVSYTDQDCGSNKEQDRIVNTKMDKPCSTQVKFKDCSIEEKIARLHGEMHTLRQTNQYLARSVEELRGKVDNLYVHTHADGAVVIKLTEMLQQYNGIYGATLIPSFDYLA